MRVPSLYRAVLALVALAAAAPPAVALGPADPFTALSDPLFGGATSPRGAGVWGDFPSLWGAGEPLVGGRAGEWVTVGLESGQAVNVSAADYKSLHKALQRPLFDREVLLLAEGRARGTAASPPGELLDPRFNPLLGAEELTRRADAAAALATAPLPRPGPSPANAARLPGP